MNSDRWLRLLIGGPKRVETAKEHVLRLENRRYARAVIVVCVLGVGLIMGAGLAFTLKSYAIAAVLFAVALVAAAIWGFVISDRLWSKLQEQPPK